MFVNLNKSIGVEPGGVVSASVVTPQDYVVSSAAGDVRNYARWGGDLIVEFTSGSVLRIINFFIDGPAFHSLTLVAGEKHLRVDFSHAIVNGGDGINDGRVVYHEVSASVSVGKLLGILGGAAAGAAGIAAAVSEHDDDGTLPNNAGRPPKPVFEVKDDTGKVSGSGLIDIGGHTNVNTPTFTGKGAVPNGRIMIRINGGEAVFVKVNEDGTWNYTPGHQLSDGDYDVRVVQVDAAGRVSDESSFQFTVDTQAPAAPLLERVADKVSPDAPVLDKDGKWSRALENGEIKKDGVTNDSTPVFSGTGEPGSMVRVYDEKGNVVGSGLVGKDGKWSVKLKSILQDGHHELSFTATDPAGNESEKSGAFPIEVDTKLPGQLDLRNIGIYNHFSDENPVEKNKDGEWVTRSLRPVFKGKIGGVDAVWIEIIDTNNNVAAIVKVDKDGTWSWQPDEDLTSGYRNYQFRAIDAAGNSGALVKSPPINIEGTRADAPHALCFHSSGECGQPRLLEGGECLDNAGQPACKQIREVAGQAGYDISNQPLSAVFNGVEAGFMPGQHGGGRETARDHAKVIITAPQAVAMAKAQHPVDRTDAAAEENDNQEKSVVCNLSGEDECVHHGNADHEGGGNLLLSGKPGFWHQSDQAGPDGLSGLFHSSRQTEETPAPASFNPLSAWMPVVLSGNDEDLDMAAYCQQLIV